MVSLVTACLWDGSRCHPVSPIGGVSRVSSLCDRVECEFESDDSRVLTQTYLCHVLCQTRSNVAVRFPATQPVNTRIPAGLAPGWTDSIPAQRSSLRSAAATDWGSVEAKDPDVTRFHYVCLCQQHAHVVMAVPARLRVSSGRSTAPPAASRRVGAAFASTPR